MATDTPLQLALTASTAANTARFIAAYLAAFFAQIQFWRNPAPAK